MSINDTAAKRSTHTTSPLWACAFAILTSLGGCTVQRYIPPGSLPYEELSAGYFQFKLRQSSALDVIRLMQAQQGKLNPRHVGTELLSQSDQMSALAGQSKNGEKRWFTLCVFDQYDMAVRRKYFFFMDESALRTPVPPQRWLIPPKSTLVFDSALVISDVLETAYASDSARSVAVLRYIRKILQQDIKPFDRPKSEAANDIVAVSGMLMNQVLGSALYKLERSPSLAVHLVDQGVRFHHITLNEGRLRLSIQGQIALMRIELPM